MILQQNSIATLAMPNYSVLSRLANNWSTTQRKWSFSFKTPSATLSFKWAGDSGAIIWHTRQWPTTVEIQGTPNQTWSNFQSQLEMKKLAFKSCTILLLITNKSVWMIPWITGTQSATSFFKGQYLTHVVPTTQQWTASLKNQVKFAMLRTLFIWKNIAAIHWKNWVPLSARRCPQTILKNFAVARVERLLRNHHLPLSSFWLSLYSLRLFANPFSIDAMFDLQI